MIRGWRFLMLTGAGVLCVALGIRQSFGLFMAPVTTELGVSRAAFGFAVALQNLLWGAVQPIVGMIADRFGARRTILTGAVFYALGLWFTSQASGSLSLTVGAGVLVGLGLSACSFAVVLGALSQMVSPEKRTVVLALASAGGSFGQFIMIPFGQSIITAFGWRDAMSILAGVALFMVGLGLFLKPVRNRDHQETKTVELESQSPVAALKSAFSHRGYRFLLAGFFVCGFHVVFIAVHLPAYLQDLGFPRSLGAQALTLIGFMNIFGTYAWGYWGGRFRKKKSLSVLYLFRAVVLLSFILLPKTSFTVLGFAFCMGATWLGTIPLTSGLVAQMFGARYLSTLFGLVFFGHQLGAFLGAWLGGWVFDHTGSYDAVWLTAFILSVASTLLHLGIADQPVALSKGRLQQSAA